MPRGIKGGSKLARFAKTAGKGGVKEVQVGVFATARYQDGTPVAAVAAWNNFGTENRDGSVRIPARPFLSTAAKTMRKPITKHLRAAMRGRKGVVSRTIASQVGLLGQREIQQQIRDGNWKPNAPSTRKVKRGKGRKKGSIKPLIDTGLMRRSVSYKIKG